jgi:type II secretory pathway pseudopilin PulG
MSVALSLVAVIAALVFYVVIPSQGAWAYARTLSDALHNARSVTLVEFERGMFGPELVFSRVSASPQQIAALRSATGAWFAPIPTWRMNCFTPHHRVEIVRADGSYLLFEICFQCQNFTLGESRAKTMPESWRERLAQFFASAGMPPRYDYSELAKKHPDYHLVQEAEREFEKQVELLDQIPQK